MRLSPTAAVFVVLAVLAALGSCAEGTTDTGTTLPTSGQAASGNTSSQGGGGTGGGGQCTEEICDGLDNDCDTLVDEDCDCQSGQTQPCYTGPPDTEGQGVCAAGSQTCVNSAWGPCNGEVLPGNEICDAKDNDCDGLTDLDDEPADVLCPPVINGNPGCDDTLGLCFLASCQPTHTDINGDFTDGCECAVEPSPIDSGAACQNAIDVGPLSDVAADSVIVSGNTAAPGRSIWWSFEATDDVDTAGDEFHVDVRFVSNPGGAYRMNVYRGGCGATYLLAAGEADSFDWYVDFPRTNLGCTISSPCGEGDCVPPPGNVGHNACNNDTETFYVQVTRTDGQASCELFQLQLSNGVY